MYGCIDQDVFEVVSNFDHHTVSLGKKVGEHLSCSREVDLWLPPANGKMRNTERSLVESVS